MIENEFVANFQIQVTLPVHVKNYDEAVIEARKIAADLMRDDQIFSIELEEIEEW